jgi:hypothetical protein
MIQPACQLAQLSALSYLRTRHKSGKVRQKHVILLMRRIQPILAPAKCRSRDFENHWFRIQDRSYPLRIRPLFQSMRRPFFSPIKIIVVKNIFTLLARVQRVSQLASLLFCTRISLHAFNIFLLRKMLNAVARLWQRKC